MQTAVRILSAILLLALTPAPAAAWGVAVHRFIMDRAIDLLPPELKPFFSHARTELVVRAVDPDVWRTAGWEDDPSHFLDFGAPELGPYPFAALPREYGAAIEKFGMATLRRFGTLPWREAEMFGNLRRAFESFAHDNERAPGDTIVFTAAATHYIQDAHQPLHASNNYDGQLTGQLGVHARFETALFDRFQQRLTIQPPPLKPIDRPRDAAFDILLESHRLVRSMLDADKEAIAGRDAYDEEYFEKFFTRVKPMLEQRIGDSIAATASLIVGAWEAAGKPPVKIDVPHPIQRVRPPKP